ncbi:MAG: glycosyltransferase family 2 protein [Candidatus Bathyarchaeota archaeon]|nr:MAG: glycosyltransferase family 2 protein [Candidatus Bathyarchaeota archaeon]
MSKGLFIIPAYNEEKHIDSVLDDALSLRESYPRWDLLVVDDGSIDSTAKIARAKGVNVIEHKENGGEEAAIQTGFDYAIKHDYDFVVKFDGDGQHNPLEVARILNPLLRNEADVVIGSRVSSYPEPLLFKIGRTFCSVFVSFFARRLVADPTSGFKGRNRAAIKHSRMFYSVANRLHNDMVNDIEELILYSMKKMRIKEVPVNMNGNGGVSKCYFSIRLFKFPIVLFSTVFRAFLAGDRA